MVDESNWSEGKIQQTAITYIRNKYPDFYGVIWHCPNGGFRDSITASIMTGQGLTRGIQDLHFVWGGKLYLIEVKTEKGEVSTAQKVVHAQHDKQGFKTYIFKSSEQIIYFVEWVILGKSLDGFDRFISPYSDGDKLDFYREIMRQERINELEKKTKKRRSNHPFIVQSKI
ncbi:MAG: hypothetical protein EOO20_03780 [Chryseobacterium sp.]|nr:MAG: hypothetical protein EOO20_03780 [Chryseobacterium sp.]